MFGLVLIKLICMAQMNSRLSEEITPFVYGTTRLGDDSLPLDQRVRIARKAMDSGLWLHTSHQYNSALQTLRIAMDLDKKQTPPNLIVKIGGDTIGMLRDDIKRNLEPLGIDRLKVAQLCLGGKLAKEFATGGACYKEFEKIRDEGLVEYFVMEVFPWTSEAPLKALQRGYTRGTIDAFIFYLNPLQRFAGNSLWDLILEKNEPVISMRTVAGGPVHRLRDVPGAAWKEYLQERAVEVAPVFERAAVGSWTQFCVRFAHSFASVISTVGSTARSGALDEFLVAKEDLTPLPDDILEELMALQYRWSDETDIHAVPWTM